MRKPITVLAVGGAALALLLAGCGGGDNSSHVASVSSPNPTSSSATPAPGGGNSGKGAELDQYRKYAECMRKHGYDMKDPDPSGNEVAGINPNDPKFAPAEEACKSVEPTGSQNPDDPALLDKERKYAECMRQNGINIPDPKPGEGMALANGDDPKYPAAAAACQKLLG